MELIDPSIDPAIESHVKAFLNAANAGSSKPIEDLSPTDGRNVLVNIQRSVKANISGIEVTEKTIEADGKEIKIFIVRPEGVKGELPAFMFFHGGGWVIGDFATHKRLVRDLVVYSGAVAVCVDYDRSPEAKFPVAINQAYAATKWVAENGKAIHVDASKLAVAGNSVGGNMAAVVALMAKDKRGPKIRFQLLMWPVTNANFETASYDQYSERRFLTRSVMKYYWDSYIVKPEERKDPYASILLATPEHLAGLPPALIQVAENDVLRDEGEAYGRKLDQSGVLVSVVRFNGMIHDFGLLDPISEISSVRTLVMQGGFELKNHLL